MLLCYSIPSPFVELATLGRFFSEEVSMVSERPFLIDFIFICQHDCPGEAIATKYDNEVVVACQGDKHTARIEIDSQSGANSLLAYLQEKLQGKYTVCLRLVTD